MARRLSWPGAATALSALFTASLTALAVGTSGGALAASGPSHVVLVVVDDLGYNDLGYRNNYAVHTPTLDNLALNGVVLENYYVQPVCTPARATLMSGLYTLHHGVTDVIEDSTASGLPLALGTMADAFAAAGYATHAVGKWNLGFFREEYTPTFRGFQSFLGYYGPGEDYYTHISQDAFDLHWDEGPGCGLNCTVVASWFYGEYSTTFFTSRAVEVVSEHDAAAAPLFLALFYQGVHSPAEAPDAYIELNAGIEYETRRVFAGMLSAVDEGVANLTAALAAKDLLEDTVLLVTTDNGGATDSTKLDSDAIGSSNFPFRGGKHSIWEGGVHGTAFLWGGDRTALGPVLSAGTWTLGSSSDGGGGYGHLFDQTDVFPTLLGLAAAASAAGAAHPDAAAPELDWSRVASRFTQHLDGVSHAENLLDATLRPPRNFTYVSHFVRPLGGQGLRLDMYTQTEEGRWNATHQYKLLRGDVKAVSSALHQPWWLSSENCVPSTQINFSAVLYPCCCAPTSPPPPPATSSYCGKGSVTPGLCLGGRNLLGPAGLKADNISDCCSTCQSTTGCVAWTFRNATSRCFLKSRVYSLGEESPASEDPDCTSSVETIQLFDLLVDKTETNDLSDTALDLVEDMSEILDRLAATSVPEGPPEEETCGSPTYYEDPQVGPAWQSWCSLE